MSITTYSSFIYGHTITDSNKYINFNEGSGELTGEIAVGSYSITEFLTAVSVAMNNEGSLNYDVTLDRSTRIITITSTASFDLLVSSGTNAAESAFSLMGFNGLDLTGAITYSGDSESGSLFEPQNILQNYVDFENNVETTNSTVNQSASGVVEVVSYGRVNFMECNIAPQTNVVPQLSIRDDANGVENLREFLDYCTRKAPIEFIPDSTNPSIFKKCLLESTRESKKGVDYKIKQLGKLFIYFQSGVIKFRELD